jgi:citrate lyase beta subunit
MLMISYVWKVSREVRQRADIQLRTRNIQAIALPKTTSADHINWLVSRIEHLSPSHKLKGKEDGIKIIAMIENARGMINIEEIARAGEGYLSGLLVCHFPKWFRLIVVCC